MNSASPAIPVRIIGDDELVQNGGQYLVEGRPAIPLLGGTAETINSGDATEGQVLTADGAGGAGWQDLSIVKLAQVPPDGAYNPLLANTEDGPLDEWFEVSLPNQILAANLVILLVEVTEYGGSAGAQISFAPQLDANPIEFPIEANQPLTRFQVLVPIVDNAFQIGFFTANTSAIESYVYFIAAL